MELGKTVAGMWVVAWAITSSAQQTPPNNMFGKWSPDGTRIAFTSDRDGDPEIYVMNAHGSNPVRLTFTPGRDAHPTWSPDGKRIAFQSPRGGDDTHLYVMNADGSDQRRLTSLTGFSGVPAWSPDGKRILFQRMEPKSPADDKWHIYVVDADGTNLRRLPSGPYNDQVPNWSPDGARVVFFSDRSGKNQIYVMNPDGTDQRRITHDDANDDTPSWSPDGKMMLFSSDRSGRRAIYRMNADGSDAREVIDMPGYQPLFAPDQSRILFHAEVNGATSLYVARPDGTALGKLTPGTTDRYLFYLHGQIVEDQGANAVSPEFGPYEYGAIVRSLADSGFTVLSEVRRPNTDPEIYADSIVRQVRRLLDRGVPARDIMVVGASKGAVIAMLVSTRLAEPDIRYVLMANCNDWVVGHFRLGLHGHVLSIYEASDSIGHSCVPVFNQSPDLGPRREVRLETGLKHGFLFRPRREWVGPAVAWARSNSE